MMGEHSVLVWTRLGAAAPGTIPDGHLGFGGQLDTPLGI